MKKTVFMSLIAIFMLSTTAIAQSPDFKMKKGFSKEKQEKIFKKKLEFFKKNLILTKDESKKFEEAYKQYSKKRVEIKKAYKTDIIDKVKAGNLSELNEKEKQKIIQRKLELDKRLYELNADFNKQLINILPSEKVIKYFELDRRFNRQLMKRFKKQKQMNRKRKIMQNKNKGVKNKQKHDQRRAIQSNN